MDGISVIKSSLSAGGSTAYLQSDSKLLIVYSSFYGLAIVFTFR